MRLIPFWLIAILLVSCASTPAPAPVGQASSETGILTAPASKRRTFDAGHAFYVEPASLPFALVPPPPKAGSKKEKLDLEELDHAQAERTAAQCAAVQAQARVEFHTLHARLPFTLDEKAGDFFWRIRSDTARAVGRMKDKYRRPRPFVLDAARFRPCYPEKHGTSYPSGHAAIARVFARVLADLDPTNATVYFREGDQAAQNRVIGGVHYPSDIQAGIKFGDVLYERIRSTPQFQKDFAELKAVSSVKQ